MYLPVNSNFTIKGLRSIYKVYAHKVNPSLRMITEILNWVGAGGPIECAVYTLMSVKMATDLTKPLDYIASGVFSEKGPAFRKFFPMTPPPLLCLGCCHGLALLAFLLMEVITLHLPLLLPWHLRSCTSKNQKEEGQRRSRGGYCYKSWPPPHHQ